MHEVFLQRLAAHPIFRDDYNFQTFLEYDGEVGKFCSRLHLMSPFLEAYHSLQEHSWEVWLHVQGFVKVGGREYHLEEPQRRGPVVWGREEVPDRLSYTVSPSSSPYYVSSKLLYSMSLLPISLPLELKIVLSSLIVLLRYTRGLLIHSLESLHTFPFFPSLKMTHSQGKPCFVIFQRHQNFLILLCCHGYLRVSLLGCIVRPVTHLRS